tara:strand:- start:155 stop:451 length:297 start_codon:yes stop_codon:yes gene_type:complete
MSAFQDEQVRARVMVAYDVLADDLNRAIKKLGGAISSTEMADFLKTFELERPTAFGLLNQHKLLLDGDPLGQMKVIVEPCESQESLVGILLANEHADL